MQQKVRAYYIKRLFALTYPNISALLRRCAPLLRTPHTRCMRKNW